MEKQITEQEIWEANLNVTLIPVIQERRNQLAKWGIQKHNLPLWMTILGEENGELCQQVLRLYFDTKNNDMHIQHIKRAREEAIQVAAVALAIIQHIDTGEA